METPGIELTVVVPTFKERDNIAALVARLHECLRGCEWEVIFVDDDSPDGTADAVRALAQHNPRVRCLQRVGRRGLASACVEGMLASAAPFLAVMDADLQHDETLLPQMLAALKNDDLDIVIGSRYAADGSLGDWDHARAAMSRIAARFSKLVVPADLTDPMSGFFMIRRATLHQVVRRLSRIGFKILVDVFASSPQPLRFKELPYQFRARHAGDSKLDSQVVWEYLMLLLDKFVGHIVPVRFLWFACVGALGVLVHVLTVMLLLNMGKMNFVPSQAIATFVSMISNFAVNNILTYRDLRLRGWRWMRGLVSFVLACSVGALANVGVAAYLFFHHEGWIVSAISGILVSSVWNYAVTSLYTWNAPSG